MDFELEADLGIDTVKQAEIMADARQHYQLAKDASFRIAEYPTLAALSGYIASRVAPGATDRKNFPEKCTRPDGTGCHIEGVTVVEAPDAATLVANLRALAAGTYAAVSAESGPFRVAFAYEPESPQAPPPDDVIAKAIKAIETGKGVQILANRGVHISLGEDPGRVAFLMPGQGTQYLGMLSELAEHFDVVRDTIAEADAIMAPVLDRPLSSYISPGQDVDPGEAFRDLTRTEITQPAVLTADIALLRLLARYGVEPDAVIGHSLGEYAACVAAGVMDFGTALRTVAQRGTAMANAKPMNGDVGWMAAVPGPVDVVEEELAAVDGYVVCANKNCPSQTIIAGETHAVKAAMKRLEDRGLPCMQLPVSHAFHTRVVAEAAAPLRQHLETSSLAPPRIPIVSNVHGGLYPNDVAEITHLLASQVASPVEFIAGIETLYGLGVRTFVEVGPKKAQAAFVKSILADRAHAAIHTCHPKQGEIASVRNALAAIWARYGVSERVAADVADDQRPAQSKNVEQSPAARPLDVTDASHASGASDASDAGQPLDTRWDVPAAVVCSGTALGLPGQAEVFADGNIDALFAGTNLIDALPDSTVDAMLAKRITRLQKGADGTADFVPVSDADGCISLGGQAGEFSLEDWGVDARINKALDRTSRLAFAAGLNALRDAAIPMVPTYRQTKSGKRVSTGWALPEAMRDTTGIIFATGFAGRDAMAAAAKRAALDPDYTLDNRIVLQILAMAHSRFAEWIGARGPNTQVNTACASTTHAIGVAQDWIRVGRCDTVIVIGADDVTHPDLMEWVGSGFLASGAATTLDDVGEAAVPFDRRRNGTILGMGAVGLVIERADTAAERGVVPVADILSTRFVNSAFHPTRLDVTHIQDAMRGMMVSAEEEFDFKAADVADRTVFISHETFTPARGGSAAAEVAGIASVFGERAADVTIANTKGFTGHPMGAGSEDVVGMRILVRQIAPPIANFKHVDPQLGALKFADGGPVNADYALRFSAGFGSQLAFALFRRRARTNARIRTATHQAWLESACSRPQSAVRTEVVSRTLRVRYDDVSRAVPTPEARPAAAIAASETLSPRREQRAAGPRHTAATGSRDTKFKLRQVALNRTPLSPHNPVFAADVLAGRDVVLIGGSPFINEQLTRAFERASATVHRITEGGERTLFHTDEPRGIDLCDEDQIRHALRDTGANPVVVNLCGYVDDKGDVELARLAARRAFHIARAWRAHLGCDPVGDHTFCSVVSLGGELGFGRQPDAVLGAGAVAGLTKSLAREWPDARVQVIDIPFSYGPHAGHTVVGAIADETFSLEVGVRNGTAFRVSYEAAFGGDHPQPNGAEVWMVSGGGRGITARVCLDIAHRFGGKFVLLGRTPLRFKSASEIDLAAEEARVRAELKADGVRVTPMAVKRAMAKLHAELEVHATLAAMREAGALATYQSADVCDVAALRRVVATASRELGGEVTHVLHGAGLEDSRALMDKDPDVFDRVFRTKVAGAAAMMDAAPDMRTFIGFSSVAGRFGNVGQADYSAANDAMSKLVLQLASRGVQAMSIDWTAWADVGMATRGSLQTILESRGVELLPPDRGAGMVVELLEAGASGEFLAAGALGALAPELQLDASVRPERVTPSASLPAVDLAVSRTTTLDGDVGRTEMVLDPTQTPYLDHHRIDGVATLPGVMGMEFFAELASELVPNSSVTGFAEIAFSSPIRFHRDAPLKLIVEARRMETEVVCSLSTERVLRTGRVQRTTHFEGKVLFDAQSTHAVAPLSGEVRSGPTREEIYRAFFHTDSFKVMDEVRFVCDDGLVAACTRGDAAAYGGSSTAADYGRMVSDPLVREMALQASGILTMIQDGRMALPHRIGHCAVYGMATDDEPLVVRVHRRHDGDAPGRFMFDVDIMTEDGVVLQALRECVLIDAGPVDASDLTTSRQALLTRELSSDAARRIVGSLGLPLESLFGRDEVAALERLRSEERRERVERALAPIGNRAEVRRETGVGRVDAARHRLRNAGGAERAFETVRSDQDSSEVGHEERGVAGSSRPLVPRLLRCGRNRLHCTARTAMHQSEV